jgi:hypothetical protein
MPLGNFQEVISSKFPLQSQIPQTARINTLSSLQAQRLSSGNPISFGQLDHMLQIPCKQERKQNSNSGKAYELYTSIKLCRRK